MPEIKVSIPEGDYCDGCPFLTKEVKPIEDIMGNLKGTEEHYVCLRHRSSLKEEEVPITPCGFVLGTKFKKHPFCKMGEEAYKTFLLLTLTILLMPKEGEDDVKTKRLPDGSDT